MMARTADWVGQVEWLHGEVASWLGAEETLRRSCNVCRAWREWCNTDLRVLHIGNDFQRLRCGGGGDVGRGNATTTRTAGLSIPLFLPLVPARLTELHLSGAWTSLHARELGTIRRGCRLKKLVVTGVRLFSFSYRELLLFEHLEELDISNSQMDIPLPPLRFEEPADGKPGRLTGPTPSGGAFSSRPPLPPPLPPPPTRAPIIPARGGALRGGVSTSSASAPFASSLGAGRGHGFANTRGGGGGGGGGRGSGCYGVFDTPRFAASLKRLVAVRTRLWNRWDLSTFASLTSIDVSFAGRTMLKQLNRKAEIGSRLAELSVCDVALRNLVRPTELTELAQAIGRASTFRLQRVDVVKEVPNLAYLRAILGRLRNLQVLELTDVDLDDGMLKVLGEVFASARVTSSSSSPPAAAAAAAAAGRGGGPGEDDEPDDIFLPSASTNGGAYLRSTRQQKNEAHGGAGTACRGASEGRGDEEAAGVVSLRTLILGRCGGVSESAFEAFLDVAGGAGGGAGPESSAKRANDRSRKSSNGMSELVGGSGAAAAAAAATATSGRGAGGSRLDLSTVRLQDCKALGDRGLAILCAGARERLSDLQVAGSLLLTDAGVENLAKHCPRLTRVDVSGCPGVTSNSLVHLLAKCPLLREVKAWGIRLAPAGSLGGIAAAPGRQQGGDEALSSPDAASASALRRAFQARGVELAWAGPLLLSGGEQEGRVQERHSGSGGGGGGGDRCDGWLEAGVAHCGGGDPCVVDGARATRVAAVVMGEGGRNPCRRGCGAELKAEDANDHVEVCPLASVACLLHADGCKWRGTRRQRRRHLETCQMWQVKCPVCCQAVHMKEFGGHVLGHSAAGEAWALHPPGCALRAYGCRACLATTAGGSGRSGGGGGSGGGTTSGLRNGPGCSSDTNHSCEAAARVTAAGKTAKNAAVKTQAAAGAAATATAGDAKEADGTVAGQEANGERGHGHHSPGMCPWYRVVCKSCEQEMSRKEWDAGDHSCPVQRRVDVLAKHASGAGKLRNRQWLIVYGYIGTGGKKGTAEGWEDRDTHFHGVNPMCAMPSGLSAALPLPGPAGAPVSPATPPS